MLNVEADGRDRILLELHFILQTWLYCLIFLIKHEVEIYFAFSTVSFFSIILF